MGCNGGLMDQAFKYLVAVGGIASDTTYPYEAIAKPCIFNVSDIIVEVCGFKDLPSQDENALQAAVANIGAISIAIDASHSSFQLYNGGSTYSSSIFCFS